MSGTERSAAMGACGVGAQSFERVQNAFNGNCDDVQEASCSTEFSATGTVPEWVHLLPAGGFRGIDGRGPWHVDNPAALIKSSLPSGGRPLLIDYEHSIQNRVRPGMDTPAAGWIVALEARKDGIWGKVDWTDRARQAIAAREWRYLSPTFHFDNISGQVIRLLNAGLTNTPNLHQLTAINRMEKGAMENKTSAEPDVLSELRAILNLPTTATATDILAAVRANVSAVSANSINAPDPTRFVPVALLEAALKEIARINTGISNDAAQIAVNSAMKDGRLPPFLEEWGLSVASRDPALFNGFLDRIAPDGRGFAGIGVAFNHLAGPPNGNGNHALSVQEKEVFNRLGIGENK